MTLFLAPLHREMFRVASSQTIPILGLERPTLIIYGLYTNYVWILFEMFLRCVCGGICFIFAALDQEVFRVAGFQTLQR